MYFATNDTERMRILADGKVGIGTAAPESLLEIQSTGTIKTNNDLLVLDETASAGSTNNNDTASSILWRGYSSDSTSIKLGRISVANSMDMTNTASTQDSLYDFPNIIRWYND